MATCPGLLRLTSVGSVVDEDDARAVSTFVRRSPVVRVGTRDGKEVTLVDHNNTKARVRKCREVIAVNIVNVVERCEFDLWDAKGEIDSSLLAFYTAGRLAFLAERSWRDHARWSELERTWEGRDSVSAWTGAIPS